MAVLILRQQGPTALPDAVVAEVEGHPDLHVLERSCKMLRVEGEARDLQAIADGHPRLFLAEERAYSLIEPDQPMAAEVKKPEN